MIIDPNKDPLTPEELNAVLHLKEEEKKKPKSPLILPEIRESQPGAGELIIRETRNGDDIERMVVTTTN